MLDSSESSGRITIVNEDSSRENKNINDISRTNTSNSGYSKKSRKKKLNQNAPNYLLETHEAKFQEPQVRPLQSFEQRPVAFPYNPYGNYNPENDFVNQRHDRNYQNHNNWQDNDNRGFGHQNHYNNNYHYNNNRNQNNYYRGDSNRGNGRGRGRGNRGNRGNYKNFERNTNYDHIEKHYNEFDSQELSYERNRNANTKKNHNNKVNESGNRSKEEPRHHRNIFNELSREEEKVAPVKIQKGQLYYNESILQNDKSEQYETDHPKRIAKIFNTNESRFGFKSDDNKLEILGKRSLVMLKNKGEDKEFQTLSSIAPNSRKYFLKSKEALLHNIKNVRISMLCIELNCGHCKGSVFSTFPKRDSDNSGRCNICFSSSGNVLTCSIPEFQYQYKKEKEQQEAILGKIKILGNSKRADLRNIAKLGFEIICNGCNAQYLIPWSQTKLSEDLSLDYNFTCNQWNCSRLIVFRIKDCSIEEHGEHGEKIENSFHNNLLSEVLDEEEDETKSSIESDEF